MTHRSSAQLAIFGSNSLTSRPDWPCFLKVKGDPKRLPGLVRINLGASKGSGFPLSACSRGLGSNVSTCDGPPAINRKITRLACGVKCGGFTDNGDAAPNTSAAAWAANSSANKPANPSIPNPLAKCPKAWRRDIARPAGIPATMVFITSVHIHKLVGAEQHVTVSLPRTAFAIDAAVGTLFMIRLLAGMAGSLSAIGLQNALADFNFLRRGQSPKETLIQPHDLGRVVWATRLVQPIRERLGLL